MTQISLYPPEEQISSQGQDMSMAMNKIIPADHTSD